MKRLQRCVFPLQYGLPFGFSSSVMLPSTAGIPVESHTLSALRFGSGKRATSSSKGKKKAPNKRSLSPRKPKPKTSKVAVKSSPLMNTLKPKKSPSSSKKPTATPSTSTSTSTPKACSFSTLLDEEEARRPPGERVVDEFRRQFMEQVPRAHHIKLALKEELSGVNMIVRPAPGDDASSKQKKEGSSSSSSKTPSKEAKKDGGILFLRAETHPDRFSRLMAIDGATKEVVKKGDRDTKRNCLTMTFSSPDQTKPLRTVIGIGANFQGIKQNAKRYYNRWGVEVLLMNA